MRKTRLLLSLFSIISVFPLTSCKIDNNTHNIEKISINIASRDEQNVGLTQVATAFMKSHPKYLINIETLQDYDNSLAKRFENMLSPIDIFFTSGEITPRKNADYANHAYNLYYDLDQSSCEESFIKTFMYANEKMYSFPIGAEVMGMFVNESILSDYNLKEPSNYLNFINECRLLSSNNKIGIKGHYREAIFNLFYPSIISTFHSEGNASKEREVKKGSPNIKTMFSSQFVDAYEIIKSNYYSYQDSSKIKNLYLEKINDETARSFLGLSPLGDKVLTEYNNKKGSTAFLPSTSAIIPYLEKYISRFELKAKYKFVLSPSRNNKVAYLTPTDGIGINKNSLNIDGCLEFIKFLFERENLITYCKYQGLAPNISDIRTKIMEYFNIGEKDVVLSEDINYSYSLSDNSKTTFKDIIFTTFEEIAQCNMDEKKYISSSNEKEMFPLSYFLENNLNAIVDKIRM